MVGFSLRRYFSLALALWGAAGFLGLAPDSRAQTIHPPAGPSAKPTSEAGPKAANPKTLPTQGRTAAPKASAAHPPKKKPEVQRSSSKVETIFEGYSKVLLGGVHIGYTVSSYGFDPQKKEFQSTYFLKTNTLGGNVTESLTARATAGFRPVSYQYTSIVGEKIKTIDAKFRGDQMTAVVVEGGKTKTIRKTIPKTAFPSTFLVYMMLKGKDGLKPGVRYGYVAIAEEDAAVYPGEANVIAPETQLGIPAFKVFVTFKGVRFASYVTMKGDVLSTRSPTQGLSTELVGSQVEAIQGLSFNPSALKTLFGRIPEGKENALVRKETGPATTQSHSDQKIEKPASTEPEKKSPEPDVESPSEKPQDSTKPQ